ncbi:MAG: tetrahydromethanopterin S-methyltransferase subunit G [Anaerolineae bacterium]|nr:tetrahydromethanopterin S-methyltransferase subunit G [Anaerolineae bacterium]
MERMPAMAHVSDLRKRQAEILNSLKRGPVLLSSKTHTSAVLVSTQQWNKIVDRLEELEDTVDALMAELALATGKDELVDWEEAEADIG